MGKIIPVYMSDDELEKLEKKMDKIAMETGKRNVSDAMKTAFFERRDRRAKEQVDTMTSVDLVYVSRVKSKVSSIIGDYLAGRDIILALRNLEAIADEKLNF